MNKITTINNASNCQLKNITIKKFKQGKLMTFLQDIGLFNDILENHREYLGEGK